MALIRKTFYNLTPVGDTSISDIEDSCIEDFGRFAATIQKEIASRKEKGYPNLKAELLIESYGRHMNINSSNIIWEEDILFDEIAQHRTYGAILGYLDAMSRVDITDPITNVCVEETYNEITKLFWNGLTLGLKIIRLGNIEYYCYCINHEIDEH